MLMFIEYLWCIGRLFSDGLAQSSFNSHQSYALVTINIIPILREVTSLKVTLLDYLK